MAGMGKSLMCKTIKHKVRFKAAPREIYDRPADDFVAQFIGASNLLAGEIAARRQKYDEAIKVLREGVKLEESLPYTEPPYWPVPVRQYLGAALLMAGQPGEAEQVYRADLQRNPNNGWSLLGLTQSLRAQHKGSDADASEQQFKSAWTHADVILAASRF